MPPLNSLNHEEQWDSIKQSVVRGLMTALRADGTTQSIVPTDVIIDDKLDRHDIKSQKEAKVNGKTWGVPVRVSFDIRDPLGQPIRSQTIKVMDLPKLTPRHSFIVNGNEYQVRNQFRLKPGVYTRVKRTGEIESQFNLVRRFGNFRLRMNPETGRYKVQFGTSNVDLLPVLDILGVPVQLAQAALGDEIWKANSTRINHDRDTRKIYRAIFRKSPPGDLEAARSEIKEHLLDSKLDIDTTKITLGTSFPTVTGDAVLGAAQKLLAINRGEDTPDNRDEMRFKKLLTPDDLIHERIVKGSEDLTRLKRGIVRRVDRSQDSREIVKPDHVEDLVHGFFNRSMLSEVPKQINPIEMLSNFAKTTVKGEGGIRDRNMVTLDSRNITPTQIGFIDPIHTPEGGEIGITNHLAVGVSKQGDKVTSRLVDARTGRSVDVTPEKLFESTVAFPDQYRASDVGFVPLSNRIKSMKAGEPVIVSPDKVDYIITLPISMFDISVNLLPFLGSLQGGRAMMAAKMQEQAVSLVDRDPPVVQVKVGDQVFEDVVGRASQVPLSPVSGRIHKVFPDRIEIRDKQGAIHKSHVYHNFPLNSKSFLHNEPIVSEGDAVVEGQPLADSPWTRNGTLALGKSMITAFLPYKGWNHEDGIVISETAANKLRSQHIYRKSVPIQKNTILDREKFQAYFPSRFDAQQLQSLDSQGVVKEGTILERGMPVVAYMARVEVTPDEAVAGKLRRSLLQPYRDRSISWDEDVSGEVIEVHRSSKSIQILIKTIEAAQVGDKLASRHANKGIVTRVLPDHEMPHLEDGTPTEILLSPSGVPSRINPSQILELGAGKAAIARGRPFLAESFRPSGETNVHDVRDAMASAGVTDKEILVDPSTGKPIGNPVAVGPIYTLKLDHPVRSKFSARGTGASFGYTQDQTPARGEGQSGQSIDHLTLYSLMGHGARENLREMSQIKGSRNDEWWRAWMGRETLPIPKSGLPFERFEALMKGMAVNLQRNGNSIQLTPMTDRETSAMSRGEIQHGRMLMGKDLRPEKGGLFDPEITGGHGGSGWSSITMAEPIPHPVFEKAYRSLLDLTESQYQSIVSGASEVTNDGRIVGPGQGAATGAGAIKLLMNQINPGEEIKRLEGSALTARASELNKINRKLRFLKNYKELGLTPDDLSLSKLPIVPPQFRPIYPLDDGNLVTNDLNHLYKDVIVVNEKLKELSGAGAPPERLIEKRQDLYQAAKAVMGLANPVTYANRQAMGIFDTIRGQTRNKAGLWQSRILKRRQDLTGRSTMTLDPALSVDEVGIPEDMAWTIMEPFIVRDLVGMGHTPLQAKEQVKQRTHVAKNSLDRVSEQRPVMINRSPSLHKHSVVALNPQLTPGKSITMHPLNLKGLGGDIDGDTVSVHVPVTERAIEEARGMMPSRNIFSVSNDLLLSPSQDMQAGLFLATRGTKKTDREFNTDAKAMSAYTSGEIRIDDIVEVNGEDTTPGRIMANAILPPALRKPGLVLDKKTTNSILTQVAKNNPAAAPGIIDGFKDLGRNFSYDIGLTVGINDLTMDLDERDAILSVADEEVKNLPANISEEERRRRTIEIYRAAQGTLEDAMKENLLRTDNSFGIMANSGARGNWSQVRQIVAAPVLYTDSLGNTVPHPVKRSFSEGLDMSDYWTSLYGARRGHIEKSVQTAEPGALNKSLIGTTIETIITSEDCGTTRGLDIETRDPRAPGRYLARPAGKFRAGERLTGDVIARLGRDNVNRVVVRSPIYCEDSNGLCRICWGHDSNGQMLDVGHPVGVMSAQAITEPLTQMAMSSFHTGGVAKRDADLSDNFTAIKQLLELPETFPGKASLAQKPGTITAIEPGLAGGFNVIVNEQPHFVPPNRDIRPGIEVGSTVEKGDRLSFGLKDPAELMKLKGPYSTREYVAEALDEIYRNAKKKIPATHFETVARGLINSTRVFAGDSGFVPGDISSIDLVNSENLNPDRLQVVPINNALGSALSQEIPGIADPGKILDEDDLIRISEIGYQKLTVNPDPIIHQPVAKGISVLPRTRKDWMGHLSFRNLGEVIDQGVPEGWQTDVVTQKPLPPYLYGTL